MSDIFTTLQDVISERLQVSTTELHPDTTLESLGIDSLAQIELMFDLEDHFQVRFESDQAPLTTLGEVAKLIESARAAGG